MKLVIKPFSELSVYELAEIYRIRVAAFIVEQNCPFQEIDGVDDKAYHLWLEDEDGIEAYARVLPAGVTLPEVAIGRVVSVKRRCGLGTKIVLAGIDVARDAFGAKSIMLEAQVYARGLYEKAGFKAVSEEFLEDGIPHVMMRLDL